MKKMYKFFIENVKKEVSMKKINIFIIKEVLDNGYKKEN